MFGPYRPPDQVRPGDRVITGCIPGLRRRYFPTILVGFITYQFGMFLCVKQIHFTPPPLHRPAPDQTTQHRTPYRTPSDQTRPHTPSPDRTGCPEDQTSPGGSARMPPERHSITPADHHRTGSPFPAQIIADALRPAQTLSGGEIPPERWERSEARFWGLYAMPESGQNHRPGTDHPKTDPSRRRGLL